MVWPEIILGVGILGQQIFNIINKNMGDVDQTENDDLQLDFPRVRNQREFLQMKVVIDRSLRELFPQIKAEIDQSHRELLMQIYTLQAEKGKKQLGSSSSGFQRNYWPPAPRIEEDDEFKPPPRRSLARIVSHKFNQQGVSSSVQRVQEPFWVEIDGDDAYEAPLLRRSSARNVIHKFNQQGVSSSVQVVQEKASIEECMEILEAMEHVDNIAYFKALEKFTSSEWRRMFVKMSNERRSSWLQSLI